MEGRLLHDENPLPRYEQKLRDDLERQAKQEEAVARLKHAEEVRRKGTAGGVGGQTSDSLRSLGEAISAWAKEYAIHYAINIYSMKYPLKGV